MISETILIQKVFLFRHVIIAVFTKISYPKLANYPIRNIYLTSSYHYNNMTICYMMQHRIYKIKQ